MNRISVNGSSFVGQPFGYHPDNEWDTCVRAVNDYFRPVETFAARFEQMLLDVKRLGFDAFDIWTAGQLSWRWATPAQIATARDLLAKHSLTVTSLGDSFGETRDEFVAACELAVGVNTKLLSGGCPVLQTERTFVIDTLERYDLYLGLENHPQRSAREMLDAIGDDAGGRIGTTVDTGWYGTQAGDVVRVMEQLDGRIVHVHLKDVLGGAESDVNVGYGKGIVPLEACVMALRRMGYTGDYSVEIHALNHDPLPELAQGGQLVRRWLAAPL